MASSHARRARIRRAGRRADHVAVLAARERVRAGHRAAKTIEDRPAWQIRELADGPQAKEMKLLVHLGVDRQQIERQWREERATVADRTHLARRRSLRDDPRDKRSRRDPCRDASAGPRATRHHVPRDSSGRTEELFGAGEVAGERAGIQHRHARESGMQRREQPAVQLRRVARDDRECDWNPSSRDRGEIGARAKVGERSVERRDAKRARDRSCARARPQTTHPRCDRTTLPRDAFENERRDRDASPTLAGNDEKRGRRSADRGQRRRDVIDVDSTERRITDVNDDEAETFAA